MASLDCFFEPESVAVIGASRTPGKIGYSILESIKRSFSGPIYPINPEANEILNLRSYNSVLEVEEPVSLAVIAVKAEFVESALEECIKKKIRGAIIISSGFSEVGEKEREESIKKYRKKIRILGPNCLGVFIPGKFDMLFQPHQRLKRPKEGSIAFLSQSGAIGASLMDWISLEGIGLSKFISYGNAIDINEIELLAYLNRDLATRCIAFYMESTDKGSEFINLAKKIVKNKPIVVLKAGKSEKGQRAVMSHTGAMAGQAQVYSAAFKQAGIIEAQSTQELFDFAKVLTSQPILKNKKIAIITDGGGFGILAADTASKHDLEMPEPSRAMVKTMRNSLPPYAVTINPFDLTGDSDSDRYQKVLDTVLKSKEYDAVVCIALLQIPTLDDGIIDVLRDTKIQGKPVVVCATGGDYTLERARKLEAYGIPVYPTPERAVKALSTLHEYAQILAGSKK